MHFATSTSVHYSNSSEKEDAFALTRRYSAGDNVDQYYLIGIHFEEPRASPAQRESQNIASPAAFKARHIQ
ncbi:hypothetical protein Hypma_013337 [Hypsizygus marmoreus]|uniref:Uncharacterized protein n=1 Tax=Hypsizygus marmoreus TaxID=39966 RepID=A0A369JJV9_HYPMA|nr:hypothetical protein Hypma_013337 [Hypsizygus marmoreus]